MPFDFAAAVRSPFRMQPGLRRLARGSAQLTPNRLGASALREKLAVLSCFWRQALLTEPDFDAQAALQAVCDHGTAEHPQSLQRQADGRVRAPHLGWSVRDGAATADAGAPEEVGACLSALPAPWRLPALLSLAFAEDFAVLDGDSARVRWLAVCLPSGWAPEEKVGRHFAEVHAPVADNERLVAAGPQLARLVTGEERWERFVWTITRHPRLNAHPAHVDPAPWPVAGDADALAGRAFFRTERQTFIPVAGRRQAVFTIHVEVHPLADAVSVPAHAAAVHDALATMSPAVLAYRGLSEVRERLLEWLARRAA